ncbi:MAG: hypothetical protein ACJASQ_001573 [Crocinitomicaceae bacterium]|jgi:hypothetical protein
MEKLALKNEAVQLMLSGSLEKYITFLKASTLKRK